MPGPYVSVYLVLKGVNFIVYSFKRDSGQPVCFPEMLFIRDDNGEVDIRMFPCCSPGPGAAQAQSQYSFIRFCEVYCQDQDFRKIFTIHFFCYASEKLEFNPHLNTLLPH